MIYAVYPLNEQSVVGLMELNRTLDSHYFCLVRDPGRLSMVHIREDDGR